MRNYWSCSKFANWLRGTPKPRAATLEGWDDWKAVAKSSRPFRYWLAEEGLDHLQKFLRLPIDALYSVKYYIVNRWVTKTHVLSTGLKPGKWHELDERLIHGMFNELVNFVEVELAWMHVVWDEAARKQFNVPFWGYGWWRFRTWRCKEAGLANLDWQRSIVNNETYGVEPGDEAYGTPTRQAINAQEILDLYTWWTVTRPARPDPYIVSGWTELCSRTPGGGVRAMNHDESRTALDLIDKLEQQYDDEDDQMMTRLIKVRKSLWT